MFGKWLLSEKDRLGQYGTYYIKLIDLLRTANTRSGYKEVYPVKVTEFAGSVRWQAKPYISPHKQQSLVFFFTCEPLVLLFNLIRQT